MTLTYTEFINWVEQDVVQDYEKALERGHQDPVDYAMRREQVHATSLEDQFDILDPEEGDRTNPVYPWENN